MTDFHALIRLLTESKVEFIIRRHRTSARLTLDLDLVYQRTRENIARLVSALKPLQSAVNGALSPQV